jgi:GTPase SAR1 family protein
MYRGSAYSIDETNDREPVDPIEKNFQIALIGDTQVGKTSILGQFVDRSFTDNVESTRGIDVVRIQIM